MCLCDKINASCKAASDIWELRPCVTYRHSATWPGSHWTSVTVEPALLVVLEARPLSHWERVPKLCKCPRWTPSRSGSTLTPDRGIFYPNPAPAVHLVKTLSGSTLEYLWCLKYIPHTDQKRRIHTEAMSLGPPHPWTAQWDDLQGERTGEGSLKKTLSGPNLQYGNKVFFLN